MRNKWHGIDAHGQCFASYLSINDLLRRGIFSGYPGHCNGVAVDPLQRRQGLGRQVLQALLSHGQRLGAERATLEVATSNTAAVALYRALGFGDAGIRRGYYRNGDDALIQWLRLPPVNDAQQGCG